MSIGPDPLYFRRFEGRKPPFMPPLSRRRALVWHFLAGVTVALSVIYLHWRWTESLNPDALMFSILVAGAETLFFVGTLIFYFDIWDEGDTPMRPAADVLPHEHGGGSGVSVDVFITTYDEEEAIVAPSIEAALALRLPEGVSVKVWLLDDGRRTVFRRLAARWGIDYLTRDNNRGFKAGNLQNALFHSDGDFVMICDADTRVFPGFLENTLGYFADPNVAWVQTPHWFYDIPEGEDWGDWVARMTGLNGGNRFCAVVGGALRYLSGKPRKGIDPFLSDPALFFDVIQRRRNRHGASFCCGAGSIHRREAIFETALKRFAADVSGSGFRGRQRPMASVDLQPFRFHVSEDIYTSMQLQGDRERRWISVYHPQVESRMLSPWTMQAWATQRLKYAGGTFDIMLRDNPLFRRGMPLRTKLHYLATFWSYLCAIWTPVMLVAPVVSMFFGIAPVEAYSLEFFAYFLPALIASELAMVAACKDHDIASGRIMATGGLAVQLRALAQVLAGKRPKFPPTPKTPVFGGQAVSNLRFVWPNFALLAANLSAAAFGFWGHLEGWAGYSVPFLAVNLFWLAWNSVAVARVVSAAFWVPPGSSDSQNIQQIKAQAQ